MKTKTIFLKKIILSYKQALSQNSLNTNYDSQKSRRKFIKKLGLAGVGLAFYSTLESCDESVKNTDQKIKVAIIGGGIAGLHAGYIFKKSKVPFEIYEATNRAGGRIYSQKGLISENLVTELGGEFIDSNHEDILNLTKELGLEILDCEIDTVENKLIKDSYHFGGRFISELEVINEFKKYVDKIKIDQGYYENDNEKEMIRLDNLSISEYIDQLGIKGWFKDFLNIAFTSEFGIDASEQSSLNLISMLSTDTTQGFKVFGESDERYKIKGGNQSLTDKLAEILKEQLIYNHPLVSIRKVNSLYELEFNNGKKLLSEFVLFAIPFTSLRNIKLDVPMPAIKKQVISELGYGTNGKVLLGFKSRKWREDGYAGYLFNEKIQNGWDNSQLQNNNIGEGGYTIFLGGIEGANIDTTYPDKYLKVMNSIFGVMHSNNKVSTFNWTKNKFTLGSYSCYKKGQWMSISGNEFTAIEKIHFAGEHCSEDFQGYMNGGAETGRKAAINIINSILKKT